MATTTEAAASTETEAEVVTIVADKTADDIIRTNMYWSMGAGVIPVTFLDTAALIAVQVKMLRELAIRYDVPFNTQAVKVSVTALLASVTAKGMAASTFTTGIVRGIARYTPVIGTAVSLLTLPAFYSAFTYAVGKVFQQHFASGGTFLTFDPKAVEDYFREKLEEGKKKVSPSAAKKAAA